METQSVKKRTLTGVVTSTAMQKTVIVRVDRVVLHPLYHKRMVRSRKYKAHDEHGIVAVGDRVKIVECRPLSKDKKWRVIVKI